MSESNEIMNPYYLLPSISEGPKKILPNSVFRPIYLSSVDYKDIISSVDVSKYVEKYIDAVGNGDTKSAYASLKHFFFNEELLYKALIESAIKYAGIEDIPLVEQIFDLIFNSSDEQLHGVTVILLTKKLCEIPNKRMSYDSYILSHLEERKNPSSGKAVKKIELANFVHRVIKGKEELDDIFEYERIMTSNRKSHIYIAFSRKKYKVLAYADPYYWAFPIQISEIPISELDKIRKEVFEFDKPTNEQKNLGIALEKGVL